MQERSPLKVEASVSQLLLNLQETTTQMPLKVHTLETLLTWSSRLAVSRLPSDLRDTT